MKRRGLLMLTAALLSAAGLGLPATASPVASIRLDGNRSASTIVTFPEAVQVDWEHAAFTGKAKFVGMYAERIEKNAASPSPHRFGVVFLRDVHAPSEAPPPLPLGSPADSKLPAGRYRIYFLSDGSASVSVPISGSQTWRLQPKSPVTAQAAMSSDILTSPLTANGDQRLQVASRRSIGLAVMLLGRTRAYAGSYTICLRDPEGECGAEHNGQDAPSGGFIINGDNFDVMFSVLYSDGALRPGQVVSHQSATNYTPLQFASGGGFVLRLQ